MDSTGTVQCPYQGLDPFSERDAELFFGRDAEVEVVSANLLTAPLTLLYGDSGVGKSSLLRAGVVLHLKRLAEREIHYLGRAPFEVVIVDHWQGDPLAAIRECLEAALGARLGDQPAPVCEPGRFVEYLAEWTDRLGGLLLFVFDQFEEYLRYHEGESGETSFAEEFPRAVRRPDLKVNFLLAVREDEYARLDRFKAQLPGLYRNYLRLRYLGLVAAREAIERPLAAQERDHPETTAPHRIEPALVDAILEDVRTGRVVLGEGGLGTARPPDAEAQIQAPYLQLVLKCVWEAELEAGSTVMRLATYEERLGKAKAIVRSHLDHVLTTLAQEDQALAAGAFRHLVTPSGAKVAHSLTDLVEYARAEASRLGTVFTPAEALRLETVLDRLCGPLRILRPVAPAGTPAGSRRFEIYTDSLVPAVLDWGNRIRRAQELAEAWRRWLVRLWLRVGLALAFLMGVYAWHKQREATVRGLIAQADAELGRNPAMSVQKMVEADARMWLQPLGVKLEAEQMLRRALLESHERPAPPTQPAGLVRARSGEWVSPDGRLRFFRGSGMGVLDLQRLATGAGAPTPSESFDTQLSNQVLAVEFNRDSSMIAVCGKEKANVWRTADLQSRPFDTLRHPPNTKVEAAAFSPDGNALATGADDGEVRWWRPLGSAAATTVGKHRGPVNAVAISPDGRFLASGSDDRTAVIWDVANAEKLATLRGPASSAFSAGDIADLPSLASTLKQPRRAIDTWLAGRLSPDTQKQLEGYEVQKSNPRQLRTLLERDLNELLRASSIYGPDRFRGIDLRPETRILLGSPLFSAGDVVHLPALAMRLKQPTRAVDTWLVAQLSSATKAALESYADQTSDPMRLQTNFLHDLNGCLQGASIAAPQRFDTNGLRAEARHLLGQNPQGEELVRLSRLLIEHAYPLELSRDRVDLNRLLLEDAYPRELRRTRGPPVAFMRVQFSEDGQFVWTSDAEGTVHYWASRIGVIVARAGGTRGIVTAAPTLAGVLFVSTNLVAGGIWKCDPSSTNPAVELAQVGPEVKKAAFSADGEWAALSGNGNRVEVRELNAASLPPVVLPTSDAVTGLGFSANAELLATVHWQSEEGKVLVWRWRERPAAPAFHGSVPRATNASVLFDRSGQRLIVGSGNDPLVFALDARAGAGAVMTNQLEFGGRHRGIVNHLALSPDGSLVLSVDNQGAAWVWRLTDTQPLGGPTRLNRQDDDLLACAFSPDGRFLLTGGEEGVAHLWDPQQGNRLLLVLPGHRAEGQRDVCAVWFSADGTQAFTAGADGTIRRHDTSELAPYRALVKLAPARLRAAP